MISKILIFFFAAVLYLACTNLQLGQTAARFYDNVKGNLHSFSDFSPTNPNQFSFSAFGDTHIGAAAGNLMLDALQKSKSDGDSFALIAGDLTNTGIDSEYATFNSLVAQGGLPVYPAIGNHDIFFGGWPHYKAAIGRSMYSFNAGSVHIIVLDTANGTFGQEQLAWLESDLKSNSLAMKVVVLHFPIYIGEFTSLFKISSDEEATIFKSLMNTYGVQLVISGHYHGYGDKLLGNTRYMVSGACNDILDIGNSSHYLKVTLSAGAFNVRQVPLP